MNKRRLSRMVVVQALYGEFYQKEPSSQERIEELIQMCQVGRLAAQKSFVEELLFLVHKHRVFLKEQIESLLKDSSSFDQIPMLLQCILLSGFCELYTQHDVSIAVIVDEYLRLCHAFNFEKHVSFVHRLLHKGANLLRTSSPEGPKP